MKKKELIMIAIILIISGAVYLGNLFMQNGNSDDYVVVYVDGEVYGRYSLDIEQEIEIRSDDEYNILEIHGHIANMTSASCPDGLCIHQHAIDKNGESIICLPNKVVIEIDSHNESEFDMIAE